MNDLQAKLDAAKSEVARLELELAQSDCFTAGHRWEFSGAKGCGCDVGLPCSLPVHQCSVCGEYDYGDNDESKSTIDSCANRAELEGRG